MEFDQVLKEANEHYGQEIFVLDEQNACRASVGDGLIIEVLYVPEVERVVLSADIGAEPPENRDRVYRLMLQAQYMFRGTAGASFALDGDTGAVYLEKPMPLATMTPESFVDSFETFACVARKWRETLADFVPLAEEIGDFERKVEASERLEQQESARNGFLTV